MKKCKKCRSEIDQKAKKCPNCGAKQGMPIWLIVIIIILVVGILASCGSEDNEPKSEKNDNKVSTTQEPTKTDFSMSETVTLKNIKFTVTNVTKSEGNEWDNPAEGKEFVIVTLKIENTSNETYSYNAFDWKMQNSQGQIDDETFSTINNDTSLNSGDLAAGGVKEGTLIFEEPKGDTELYLNYNGNIFSSSSKFRIKIN